MVNYVFCLLIVPGYILCMHQSRVLEVFLRFRETLAAFLMFVAEPVGLALIFILWRMFINFPT